MKTLLLILCCITTGCSLTQIQVHATYQHDEQTKVEISGNISPTLLTSRK